MKRLIGLLALIALVSGCGPVRAQGIIAPGHVMGNGTASSRTPTDAPLFSILDQNFSGVGFLTRTGTGAYSILSGATGGRLLVDQGAGSLPAFVVMSGDGTLAANGALTLAASGVTAGTYGDGTHVAQVTFDAKGRATAAASVAITHASLDLAIANNLSDLQSVTTARANLDLTPGTGLAISGSNLNLQPAQAATIGGIESVVSTPHQWVAYIDTSGIPHQTQPSFADISGSLNLATQASGNLPVTNLNSGTSASSTTFWRGDGQWATPAGSGNVIGTGTSVVGHPVVYSKTTGTDVADSGVPIFYGIPNASGSAQTTTGSMSASSTTLTLASAIDFKNGEGILIPGAGPTASVGAPTGLTYTVTGAAGTTTCKYQVATVDASDGVSAASSVLTVSNAPATPTGTTNYGTVSWTAPATGTPNGYLIYGECNGGSLVYLGAERSTSFADLQAGTPPVVRFWIPASPPGAATNDNLVTSVSSGGGTTSLTLASAATAAVSGATIYHDDTVAFQAAINALPASGGTLHPTGTYNVSSNINIGNGAANTYSTTYGQIIQGPAIAASGLFWPQFPSTSGFKLVWNGPPAGFVFNILGPLQGWGLRDAYIDCGDVASIGLFLQSAQFGNSSDLAFNRCQRALVGSTVQIGSAGGEGNTMHNFFGGYEEIQAADFGTVYGIFLTTGYAAESNSTFNEFHNLSFGYNTAHIINYPFYLDGADGNTFYSTQITFASYPIVFDYGSNSNWPAGNMFYMIDFGSSTQEPINFNSPGAATPNVVWGLNGTNGAVCPAVALANFNCHAN